MNRVLRTTVEPREAGRHHSTLRSGFSLIEVIIATAILLGSVIVLSQLAWMGRTQLQKANRSSKAQQVCDTTMSEFLLGLRTLQQVESEPLIPLAPPLAETEDNTRREAASAFATSLQDSSKVDPELAAEWLYAVRLTEVPEMPGLWSLTVEVLEADESLDRRASFSIQRWIRSASDTANAQQSDLNIFDMVTGPEGLR